MIISYIVATLLAFILPISNPRDFCALRIAATFPNVVALPILVFPSLCEYPVVYEAFGSGGNSSDNNNDNDLDDAEMYRQCNARANTMIFVYFFGWSFVFYSFGHRALMNAANMKVTNRESTELTNQEVNPTIPSGNDDVENDSSISPQEMNTSASCTDNNDGQSEEGIATTSNNDMKNDGNESLLASIWRATKQTLTSPPFIAMVLAFIVGCITPVRDQFFSQGGALRFLGSALETLGQASSSITTMVVAASLVPPKVKDLEEEDNEDDNHKEDALDHDNEDPPENLEPDNQQSLSSNDYINNTQNNITTTDPTTTTSVIFEESPVMSDPSFGPYQLRRRRQRSSMQKLRKSIQRKSLSILNKVHRTPSEIKRMYVWFTLSRLILSPAVVVAIIVGMECGGWLHNVPDLAKLVLILNSAVPGASTVVVLLKSNSELHETASVLAKAYLPTYIISVVTIAGWTALALYISIPDENGNTFCHK